MPALTPSWMMDLETNMRVITAQEYQRLNSNVWWNRIAKRIESTSRKERLLWLLDTARIQVTGRNGGNLEFEDIVATTTEIESENAAAGLKLKKEQLEDTDGNGVDLAAHWSRQMGAQGAYWPQKLVAKALLSNPTGYDGVSFFNTAHPVNPFDAAAGTYSNVFTGSASGIYPGALPIHNVTVDVAVQNIAKAIAYVASLKMPNGEDPRFLRLAAIFVPPALTARAQQITNAKYIAQAAATGGGSGDVEAVVRNFGLGQPVECPELSSAFTNGSDTDYYLAMEEITTNPLGAFNYIDREPFSVVYHGPMTSAELARSRVFQWTTEGRNKVAPGHPFLLFKCKAT